MQSKHTPIAGKKTFSKFIFAKVALKEKFPFFYKILKVYALPLHKIRFFLYSKFCQHTIHSLAEILLHCDKSEIISFDFFDTLVHRIISPPDKVKNKTAEFACMKLKQLNYEITSEKFNQIRNNEEEKIRHENFYSYGKDKEANIFSIIDHTLLSITGRKRRFLTRNIVDYEIKNEINHLYLNKDAKKIMGELKNCGKKIIVCSDMYLLEEQLKQIATYFDIAPYIDKFYVSSTRNITKSSGRLFQFVLQDFKTEAKKILHIGDNLRSDYITPKKLAIKALFYFNKYSVKNYKKIERQLYSINYTKRGISDELINQLVPIKHDIKDDHKIISQTASPALALFAYQALLKMHEIGVKKVFFIAREGILFKKIFSEVEKNVLIFKAINRNLELKILYISRLSSACANYYNAKNIDILIETCLYAAKSLSILNVLTVYGISLSDFSNNALKIIKPYETYIDKKTLVYLFKSTIFGPELDKLLNKKIKLLKNYLSEQGVLSQGKIGLVDLGWGGTIQKNISHFLADYPSTEFFGYYFATNHLISEKHPLSERSTLYPGYIAAHQNHYQTERLNGAAAFLESLCGRDDIGTTLGYQLNKTHAVIPILQKSPAKKLETISFQKNIRHCLIHDIKNFSQLFNIASLPLEKLKDYASKKFMKFIFKPTNIDIKKFLNYKINYNWATNRESPLITTLKISDVFNFKALLIKIQRSPWRYGTLVAAPIPGLLSLYNLLYYCFSYSPKLKKLTKFLTYQKNLKSDA